MQPGELLAGRYRFVGLLGRGGMGEVLLAHDLRLDTRVAIKRIPRDLGGDPHLAELLIREARLMVRLNHPHVVRLYDLTEDGNQLLMVMEYICGPSLQQLLRARGQLSEQETIHLLRDICAGLSAVHEQGVVHRDLKPGNLLLAVPPEGQAAYFEQGILPVNAFSLRAKVTDFGISKATLGQRTATTGLQGSGSPSYMAPEQLRGGVPTAASDVYALGVTTYQMLSGRTPFDAPDPAALAYQHLFESAPALTGVSPAAAAAVAKAMAKTPQDRFAGPAEFLAALEGRIPISPLPVPPRPDPPPPQPQPDGNGLNVWMLSGCAVAFIVALIVVGIATAPAILRAMKDRPWPDPNPTPPIGQQEPTTLTVYGPEVTPPPFAAPPFGRQPPPVVDPPPPSEPFVATGPRDPKLQWSLRIKRTNAWEVATVGRDGTVFAYKSDLDGGSICAVKPGAILWGVQVAGSLHMPDGRFWFHGMRGTDCVNARGEAVHLPASYPRESSPDSGVQCGDDPRTGQPILAGGYLSKPRWIVPLAHDCYGLPIKGPNGDLYFATKAQQLYRVSPTGVVRWTAPLSCMAQFLRPMPSGDVMIVCEKRELIRIADGRPAWQFHLPRDVYSENAIEIDKMETVYLPESGPTGDSIIAVDAKGQQLWERRFEQFGFEHMKLTWDGQLFLSGYLNGMLYNGALLSLSDTR